MVDSEQITEQKESVKLEKNTRGYNWELRIYALPSAEIDDNGQKTGKKEFRLTDSDLQRLNDLNEQMIKKYNPGEII